MAAVMDCDRVTNVTVIKNFASPGLHPVRLVGLMLEAIEMTSLDLSGMTVLTEAATGAYAVTPVIAALAGARRVVALTAPSRYGSVEEVAAQTERLAAVAGVAATIEVTDHLPKQEPLLFDLVTNSGHLRPLNRTLIDRLPAGAVIALMFEAWEFREQDIDRAACAARGIPIVGVNECHPSVDVFSYLAPLSAKLLFDAGVAVYHSRIALLCDNPFAESIARGLTAMGARVKVLETVDALPAGRWDALLCAFQPELGPPIDAATAAVIAARAPGAAVTQLWGDVDRSALAAYGIRCWPVRAPKPGHMAVLLSDIGPEPVIRLQTGGLAAAERVWRHGQSLADPLVQVV